MERIIGEIMSLRARSNRISFSRFATFVSSVGLGTGLASLFGGCLKVEPSASFDEKQIRCMVDDNGAVMAQGASSTPVETTRVTPRCEGANTLIVPSCVDGEIATSKETCGADQRCEPEISACTSMPIVCDQLDGTSVRTIGNRVLQTETTKCGVDAEGNPAVITPSCKGSDIQLTPTTCPPENLCEGSNGATVCVPIVRCETDGFSAVQTVGGVPQEETRVTRSCLDENTKQVPSCVGDTPVPVLEPCPDHFACDPVTTDCEPQTECVQDGNQTYIADGGVERRGTRQTPSCVDGITLSTPVCASDIQSQVETPCADNQACVAEGVSAACEDAPITCEEDAGGAIRTQGRRVLENLRHICMDPFTRLLRVCSGSNISGELQACEETEECEGEGEAIACEEAPVVCEADEGGALQRQGRRVLQNLRHTCSDAYTRVLRICRGPSIVDEEQACSDIEECAGEPSACAEVEPVCEEDAGGAVRTQGRRVLQNLRHTCSDAYTRLLRACSGSSIVDDELPCEEIEECEGEGEAVACEEQPVVCEEDAGGAIRRQGRRTFENLRNGCANMYTRLVRFCSGSNIASRDEECEDIEECEGEPSECAEVEPVCERDEEARAAIETQGRRQVVEEDRCEGNAISSGACDESGRAIREEPVECEEEMCDPEAVECLGVDVTRGLILELPFDILNPGGTTPGNTFDGAGVPTPFSATVRGTLLEAGAVGNSLFFRGSDFGDMVNVPIRLTDLGFGREDLTINFWTRISPEDVGKLVFMGNHPRTDPALDDFVLETRTPDQLFLWWDTPRGSPNWLDISCCGGSGIRDNTWHMITYRRDVAANNWGFYVDGNLLFLNPSAGPNQFSSRPEFGVGYDLRLVDPEQVFFRGNIDEITMHNRALTEAELRFLLGRRSP